MPNLTIYVNNKVFSDFTQLRAKKQKEIKDKLVENFMKIMGAKK